MHQCLARDAFKKHFGYVDNKKPAYDTLKLKKKGYSYLAHQSFLHCYLF